MPEPLAPTKEAGVAARSVALAMAIGIVVAACGSISAPRATAGPIATVAPAASIAPATPSRSPDTHEAAIAAFVESVTSGDLTYRIAYAGEMRLSASLAKIKGAMTVVGEDFATAWTYDFDEGLPEQDVQVRGVAGEGYVKREGEGWTSIKGYDLDDSYVPFKHVGDSGDVRYLGPVVVGDETLHRISVPDALLMHPTTVVGRMREEKIERMTTEVRIDDKGRPRTGTWEMSVKARIGGSGQLQRVVYELELTFSKVGDQLTVKKP